MPGNQSNAPLLANDHVASGGDRLPEYAEAMQEARKPSIFESFQLEMVTGALVLFLGVPQLPALLPVHIPDPLLRCDTGMVLAELLAAVPYCTATDYPPYYRGNDGFSECVQNFRQASVSTPDNCGSNEDGGCYWNNVKQGTYAVDLGTVDLSIAVGLVSKDTESFSVTASLKPTSNGRANTLLSYGNPDWLSGPSKWTSASKPLGWALEYTPTGNTGGSFRFSSSGGSGACSLSAPQVGMVYSHPKRCLCGTAARLC